MFWKYDEEKDKVVKKPLSPDLWPQPSYNPVPPREDEEINETSKEEFQSSDETGAEERFEARVATFMKEEKPVYKHHFWWFVHNCIAHPMIGILPNKSTFDFHDWTSKKINGK